MFFKNIIANFKKYRFLLKQLVSRDFKVKYKRSVLGILWSILNPLLTMAVMALVFSQVFKFSVPGVNYLVYLLTGLVLFNYFSEASNLAMGAVTSNASLINKLYIPKYIFPLSKVLFCGINFLLTLIPLALIILITGDASEGTKCTLNIYYLLLPFCFLFIFLFTTGVGFLLSTIAVFFRDMFYIYGILLSLWQYLTPIMYDVSIIPAQFQTLFKLNPFYWFIDFARQIILFNQLPSLTCVLACSVSSIIVFIVGLVVFKMKQDKFIYYV